MTTTRVMPTQTNTQLEEMARALRILIPDGQVVELRVPKVDGKKGRTDSGYFSDMSLLPKAAIGYNRKAHGVYITPNPVNPALLARAVNRVQEWSETTTADSDITRRVWLLIDADPKRPSNISSSDDEHEAALEMVRRIRNWLAGLGWPEPVLADSGNGGHLLYRIDLPNDQDSTTLIQQCLQALSAMWDDETVTIDTTVFNAARIWKLYGTVAGKGDHTPDRPHRQSRIIEAPTELAPVPVEMLKGLAANAPKAEGNNTRQGKTYGDFNLDTWLQQHNITGSKAPWNGGSRWKLDACPFNDAHTDGAFVVQLSNGAISAGCWHNSCQGKNWKTLRELKEGTRPQYVNGASAKHSTATPTGDKAPQREASKNPKTAEYIDALVGLGYTFCMNDLDDTLEVNGKVISDGVEAEIRSRMRDLGYEKIKAMEDSYKSFAHNNRYHPIKRYLEGLTWDGEDHIFTLATYFDDNGMKIKYETGGERGVFLAFLRRWLIGAVAKVYGRAQNPMLVLTGAQGKGKSYFAKWLCSPIPEHHIEESVKPDSNEHDRFLAKKWIWEVGELGATTKRQDIEALKQFLTRVDCDFRTPYAHNPVHKPAMASFIGTVNPSAGFLVDPTGNRRYIVVDLAAIKWLYAQEVDVNQVWAQAYHLWKSGESPALTEEEKAYQSISNEQHTIEDPYEGWVRRTFDIDLLREDWMLTTSQITATLQDRGVRGDTRSIQMRLAETLKGIGLRRHANARPRC